MIDLDYADKLPDMDPQEVAVELMALAVAVRFDRRKFTTAARLDLPENVSNVLFHETIKGYAETWKTLGYAAMNETLDPLIQRWRVITA